MFIEAWEVVTMDFIDGLPKSAGSDCILVVVDKFTLYGHFIPYISSLFSSFDCLGISELSI
jgi:hypothetical protein